MSTTDSWQLAFVCLIGTSQVAFFLIDKFWKNSDGSIPAWANRWLIAATILGFGSTIGAFFTTIQSNEDDKTELMTELERQDSINNVRLDTTVSGMTYRFTEALAKYNLKVDSNFKDVASVLRDSIRIVATTQNFNTAEPNVDLCYAANLPDSNSAIQFKLISGPNYRIKILFCNINADAQDVSMTISNIREDGGKIIVSPAAQRYTYMHHGKIAQGVKGGIESEIIIAPDVSDTLAFFVYGTYRNTFNDKVYKQFTFYSVNYKTNREIALFTATADRWRKFLRDDKDVRPFLAK